MHMYLWDILKGKKWETINPFIRVTVMESKRNVWLVYGAKKTYNINIKKS